MNNLTTYKVMLWNDREETRIIKRPRKEEYYEAEPCEQKHFTKYITSVSESDAEDTFIDLMNDTDYKYLLDKLPILVEEVL